MAMIPDGMVDVIDLLEKIGVKNITDVDDEVVFSCPFPGHSHGDEKPSAYMNKGTTQWYCHGCKRRGNATQFVAQHENVSPMRAARWLRDAYGEGFKEPEGGSIAKEWDEHWEQGPDTVFEDVNPPLDEALLKRFAVRWNVVFKAFRRGLQLPAALTYPLERGLDLKTLQELEFGYDRDSSRITFAVRDEEGNLVGFKGRAWDPDVKPKYKVLGDMRPGGRYGFRPYKVGQVVYLMDRAKDAAHCGRLIVCEGELNAVAMRQHGYPESVGLGGSEVTQAQADIIARYTDEVHLIFDSDEAGKEGLKKAVEMLESRVRVKVVADHDGDPASMTKAEVKGLLETLESTLTRVFA